MNNSGMLDQGRRSLLVSGLLVEEVIPMIILKNPDPSAKGYLAKLAVE
jgi:hypothetical protein